MCGTPVSSPAAPLPASGTLTTAPAFPGHPADPPSSASFPRTADPRNRSSGDYDWSGHELAMLVKVKPRNMLTQLGEWSRLGFFTRTGFGTYRLNTPSHATSSTAEPDP